MWELGPEGAASRDLHSLSLDWDRGAGMLHIGTFALPCQTDSNIPLVEIYKNIVTSPWPDLKNKGSDIKKSATMNPTPSFPFKGAC